MTLSFSSDSVFWWWQNKPCFPGLRTNSFSGKVLRMTSMDCCEFVMTWLWRNLIWSHRLKMWMKNYFSLRGTMRRWEQQNTVLERFFLSVAYINSATLRIMKSSWIFVVTGALAHAEIAASQISVLGMS